MNEWTNFINVSIEYLAEGKPSTNRGHLTKHKNVLNWPNLCKTHKNLKLYRLED